MTRQRYLIEHYRPSSTAEVFEQWAAEVRAAAIKLARAGEPVRYLHSTTVPSDESLLCVVEAASDELVRELYTRAGLSFERLTAVISDDITSESEGDIG